MEKPPTNQGSFLSLGIKELGLHCYCPSASVSKESMSSLTLSREERTEMVPQASHQLCPAYAQRTRLRASPSYHGWHHK